MHFSLISAIATLGSVVMAQPVPHAVSSQQVVDSLKLLTNRAQGLQAPAQSTNLDYFTNTALINAGQGPLLKIFGGHADIVSTGTTIISQLDGAKPFNAEDCSAITGSFKEFASVNQAYLNTLIGKADIFNKVQFIAQPVAITLKQVGGVYNDLSTNLINLCASTAQDLTSEANSLGATLDHAITTYGSVGKI